VNATHGNVSEMTGQPDGGEPVTTSDALFCVPVQLVQGAVGPLHPQFGSVQLYCL
jgi:hypothetical protein